LGRNRLVDRTLQAFAEPGVEIVCERFNAELSVDDDKAAAAIFGRKINLAAIRVVEGDLDVVIVSAQLLGYGLNGAMHAASGVVRRRPDNVMGHTQIPRADKGKRT
jgi:hypothetical protein